MSRLMLSGDALYLRQFLLYSKTNLTRVLRAPLAELQADDGLACKVRTRVSAGDELASDLVRHVALFGAACRGSQG